VPRRVDWEGWHGFRRGLATNLERIGVRDSIGAMVLHRTNYRVTRKHYIKLASIEAIAAMRQLSENTFGTPKAAIAPQLLPKGAEGDHGHG
jgi:hypothetical protein